MHTWVTVATISIVFTDLYKGPRNRLLLFFRGDATLFSVYIIDLERDCVCSLSAKIIMNFVEPIRDRKKIAQIKNLLRGQNRYRDLLLFVTGINSALRISDLLELKIGQVIDEKGTIRSRFSIKEQKRGKRQEVTMNDSIREALQEYLAEFPDVSKNPENFIFAHPNYNHFATHIKRGQAWKFITRICQDVGLSGNFGTHSLRKTWGYHARMSGVDVALIMHKLNHESIAYTKRYLGITNDELQAIAQRLNL